MKGRLAYLFPAFPVLHQTFVLWEVIALRELGLPITIYSIKRPGARTQQPEGVALASEVRYLPAVFSLPVIGANLTYLRRSPGRYFGAALHLCRQWWRERGAGKEWKREHVSRTAPERQFTRREELSGWFNRSPTLFLLKSLWLLPLAVHLGAELQREGIGRLHAHWASYPGTMALLVHWLYGIPFSISAHAYDIYLVPRLLAAKLRHAEIVVTCARINARFLASLVEEPYRWRIAVNYHGVNLDRFRPRPRPAAPAHTRTVLTCGRLEPYKGHHVLLAACAKLGPEVRCVIVGEGPQQRRLEALARELGIAERVELTGPLPQTELVERYAEADVFVLSSVVLERSGKRDVIPNVLAEAMAMRVPVVASDVSGISELVEDGVSGRLVPPNDPDALAAALSELFGSSELCARLAEGGERKVRADFDRRKNVRALAALLAPPAPDSAGGG